MGYRFLFNYAQQQADIQLQYSLDNNQYNDAELIAVKVPLSMPYQAFQSDWERVDGEINIKGKIYNYVKRKIVDGEMVLMCLPDNNKMRIQSARDDFFKNTNDIAQDNAAKKSGNSKTEFFKNLASEYDQQITTYCLLQLETSARQMMQMQNNQLPSAPHTPLVQPPDAL